MANTALEAGNAPIFRAGTSDAEIEAAALKALARRKYVVKAWQIGILLAILGLWQLASDLHWIDPFFYSSPYGIALRLWEWITEGTESGSLWYHLGVTMEEALIGFIIGSVTGVLVGVALGRNKLASDILSIYIKAINSIPRVVLAPIFVMIMGLGLASKVALAFIMVFFVVFANAFQGVREADRAMIANAQILGASRRQVTTAVVIPSALSWILASLHVSFGFALVGAVVGEFLGSKQGIGLLISTAQGAFNASGVFAAMIVLAVVALLADYLLTSLEKRLLKWRPAAF